jgi:hypothetical protein
MSFGMLIMSFGMELRVAIMSFGMELIFIMK